MATFDFESMKALINKTKPTWYFNVQKVVAKVQPRGPGDFLQTKEDSRMEANMFTKNVVKTMISDGYITREEIADNIDVFMRSAMGVGTLDTSTTTKLSVHYYLYLK